MPFRGSRYIAGLLLLSCFSLYPVSAVTASPTTAYTLTGTVLDSESGNTLAGAHVFVLESTVGTVTDEHGNFSLSGLTAGELKIGVSMLGFSPYTFIANPADIAGQSYKISLKPQVYELEQVTVTGKRSRRWRKQLKTFTHHVIGDTENARETKIVNPEVLTFVQRKGILIAEAQKPLIIENHALGYRIHYTLVHCAIQNKRPQYKGIARFEEMEPKNARTQKRWLKNRDKAYKGSFKHLLRTMARVGSLEEIQKEGFHVAHVREFPESIQSYERAIWKYRDPISTLVEQNTAQNENLLHIKNYLLITYSGELESNRYVRNHMMHAREPDVQRSSIELRTDSTVFHDLGYLYDAYSVVLHGYMGWERMAEMLPLDYAPVDG